MGWFWADSSPPVRPAVKAGTPPPGCPMHRPDAATAPAGTGSGCPYVPPDAPLPAAAATAKATMAESPKASGLARLNPLNYMPFELSNRRAANQKAHLPVSREISTIPKEDGSLWEYPSPQQMYNAMLRKGYDDTPEDAVESMVAVHNFLNEGAWAEIREWERRFSGGLAKGWQMCSRGEDGVADDSPVLQQDQRSAFPEPRLVRFMGRPGELTPKAQVLQALGWLYPAKFGTEPPFDRHDWFVQRTAADGSSREVRYVIDYYSGEPDPTGEEVFYLDVRPAVDSPTAALERAMRWSGDIWWKASGGIAREIERERKKREGR